MRIVMFGPPGAGKGTQADILSQNQGFVHISTGDLFRQAIKDETALGVEAKKYLDAGALVPDDITVGMLRVRIEEDDCAGGYILDGFPRTIEQADALTKLLSEEGQEIDRVININVDDETLIRRLTGRRVCKGCGKSFHIDDYPSKKGDLCDVCGGILYTRDDDKEEIIRQRLRVYHEQTSPLIDYYKNKGLLADVFVDKKNDVKELVTQAIYDALEIG